MHMNPRVTGFQHGMLIVGALIANGIFSLPRVTAEEAGRSAWVAVAGAGLAVLLVALLSNRLASLFPGEDPAQWGLKLMGPLFGRVWLLLYLTKSCFFVILTMRIFAAIITNRMLTHTPSSVLAAVILLLSVFAALAGIGGLARFAEISVMLWFPLMTLLAVIFLGGHLHHLQPVFGDADPSGFLAGAKTAAYSYAGFDILLFSYPHLQKPKESIGAVLWSVIVVTAVYTLTTVAALAFFGLEHLTRLLVPTLVMLGIAETSVIERFDSLAIFMWIGMVVVTSGTQLYMGTRLLQGLIPNVSFAKTVIFLGTFLLVASWGETSLRQLCPRQPLWRP
ncbi:MAG: Spore germination protein YndE [Firmicutes bacterium]|nr:Spore germination protein YndE [Bacillota bacterium]